jgi:RNA polymerase sigma-70 factor (ECF subfamily)
VTASSTSEPSPGTGEIPRDSAPDDETLVRLAKSDRAAFAPLYDRYVDAVYRYCRRRLGSREAAEDATALVFMKAMTALPGYRDDGSSFRSWLFAIAHNALVDQERSRRDLLHLDAAAWVADQAPGPEELALSAEAQRDVRALLAAVSPDQRRVLELRLAGLRTAEIAFALDRSQGAVRGLQLRAEERLRSLLGVAAVSRVVGHD